MNLWFMPFLIKNLEYETGIDFFCNLPNEIEKTVEATYSADDWAW